MVRPWPDRPDHFRRPCELHRLYSKWSVTIGVDIYKTFNKFLRLRNAGLTARSWINWMLWKNPVPKFEKDVRVFLGLTGYYRQLIINYAIAAAALTDLIRKSANEKVIWSDWATLVTVLLVNWRIDSAKLRFYGHLILKSFILQTDSSDYGIWAVLTQKGEDGTEHSLAYYSKKLFPWKERYSTVEKSVSQWNNQSMLSSYICWEDLV